jgi:lipopolysaccharide biosynthesis glycosyltransferase
LSQLKDVFNRDNNKLQSTEFSFSRFLVPYLSNYEGYSIFIDCDMLFFEDINKLWSQMDDKYALMATKHNYKPKSSMKFLNNEQSTYEKKNWSSVMIFNNKKCKSLTPDYVNTASGLDLHQFKWLDNDDLIGDIDLKWNFLVDEYPHQSDIFNAHYTLGGAYFKEYENCPYSKEWKKSLKQTLFAKSESSFLTKIYKELE